MLQNDRKIKEELRQGIISEEKTHQLVAQSTENEKYCNPTTLLHQKYNSRIENTRKRDFVIRVYRDFGLICEVETDNLKNIDNSCSLKQAN
jgi:hypothetical protein